MLSLSIPRCYSVKKHLNEEARDARCRGFEGNVALNKVLGSNDHLWPGTVVLIMNLVSRQLSEVGWRWDQENFEEPKVEVHYILAGAHRCFRGHLSRTSSLPFPLVQCLSMCLRLRTCQKKTITIPSCGIGCPPLVGGCKGWQRSTGIA